MELRPYIESIVEDLTTAAAVGDDTTREAVSRVLRSVDPAVRLAFIQALSESAVETTSMLQQCDVPAIVRVEVVGREPQLNVEKLAASVAASQPEPPTEPEPVDEPDDAATARITLRLPEGLKARAEAAAEEAGQSLNTFIVAAVRAATAPGPRGVHPPTIPSPPPPPRTGRGRRLTGWL